MNDQDSSFRYTPLRGLYDLPEGQEIVQYYDRNSARDMFGRPVYQYALINPDGSTQAIDNINNYSRLENGEQQGFGSGISIINDPNNKDYHGRYELNFSDSSGENTGYSLYVDPKNPEDVILHSKDFKGSGINGRNIRIPKEFAQIINKYPTFWNNLLKNKSLQERFLRSMYEGVSTGVGDYMRRNLLDRLGVTDVTLSKGDLVKLGLSEQDAESARQVLHTFGKANGRNRSQRREERLVVPMNQSGGVIATTKDPEGKKMTQKIDTYHDISKAAGSKDDWDLSSADKLELASFAGDVASLIASIPTGGNPVAAAIGAGSTFTQFGADVRRDGLDWGDVGNLVLGLGLDAVTLLPGAGVAGKTAKLAKNIKKVANPLRRVLALAGATQAVTSVNRLANGEGNLND